MVDKQVLAKKLFTTRNKLIALVMAIVVIVYWFFIIEPILLQSKNVKQEISVMEMAIQNVQVPDPYAVRSQDFSLLPRDQQLSKIVDLIDSNFNKMGIKLIYLRQSAADNKLEINIKFHASYEKLLSFFDLIAREESVVVVETLNVNQVKNYLAIEMKIISGYL
ncbi:MAG: hypothetical protein ABIE84_05775 [bacterium]